MTIIALRVVCRCLRAGGSRVIAISALAAGFLPAAAAMAAGENVIFNPDFAHGLRGWRSVSVARGTAPGYPRTLVVRTPREPLLKCERGQMGHAYLQMDVAGNASGYVEQSIVVPVSPGRLTFRTWGDLEPASATVSIVNGPAVRRLLTYQPPTLQASPSSCSGSKPITESLDLTRYAGQAVGLRIRATSRAPAEAIVDFGDFVLEER